MMCRECIFRLSGQFDSPTICSTARSTSGPVDGTSPAHRASGVRICRVVPSICISEETPALQNQRYGITSLRDTAAAVLEEENRLLEGHLSRHRQDFVSN